MHLRRGAPAAVEIVAGDGDDVRVEHPLAGELVEKARDFLERLRAAVGASLGQRLENVGDGRYLFRRGTGYLVGKDGRPVVVDLNWGR